MPVAGSQSLGTMQVGQREPRASSCFPPGEPELPLPSPAAFPGFFTGNQTGNRADGTEQCPLRSAGVTSCQLRPLANFPVLELFPVKQKLHVERGPSVPDLLSTCYRPFVPLWPWAAKGCSAARLLSGRSARCFLGHSVRNWSVPGLRLGTSSGVCHLLTWPRWGLSLVMPSSLCSVRASSGEVAHSSPGVLNFIQL